MMMGQKGNLMKRLQFVSSFDIEISTVCFDVLFDSIKLYFEGMLMGKK